MLTRAWLPRDRESLAGFPIFTENFWLKDGSGGFVSRDDEARRGRRTFTRQTEGMPDGALAVIEAAQPYKSTAEPRLTPLGLLHRLENADKHRRLLVTQYVFDISHLPWVGLDGLPLTGPDSQSTIGLASTNLGVGIRLVRP
ncbi:MAG: hypothetical protein WEE67_04525 [Chloroflexota bacterium]